MGYEGNKKDVIKIMLQKELLPVKSINPVYELLRGYKLNKNIAWKKIGRPAIFSDQQLHKRVKLHEHDVARACSKNDMKTFLKEEKMKKATDQGLSSITVNSPDPKTLHNYRKFAREILGDRYGGKKKVQQKSRTRYIAERSLRGCAAYLFTRAVTHFQLGLTDRRFPKIEDASEGAQKFYNLIKKENAGMEIRPVPPFLYQV